MFIQFWHKHAYNVQMPVHSPIIHINAILFIYIYTVELYMHKEYALEKELNSH